MKTIELTEIRRNSNNEIIAYCDSYKVAFTKAKQLGLSVEEVSFIDRRIKIIEDSDLNQ